MARSEDAMEKQALKATALVPIRVEFETETHRVRDCFVWDMNDDLIKPSTFARIFCDDLDLPKDMWVETIANQIRAQLEEYEGIASMDLGSGIDGYTDAEANDTGLEVPECRVILSVSCNCCCLAFSSTEISGPTRLTCKLQPIILWIILNGIFFHL